MDWKEIAERYQIITEKEFIKFSEVKDKGIPVYIEDNLLGYYLERGYEFVGLRFKPFVGGALPIKLVYRICFLVVSLNRGKNYQVLKNFCLAYINSLIGESVYQIKEKLVNEALDTAYEKADVKKLSVQKKYYWIKYMERGEKQVVMNQFNAQRRRKKTEDSIEECVNRLKKIGEKVSPTRISEMLGISRGTVYRYL